VETTTVTSAEGKVEEEGVDGAARVYGMMRRRIMI